MQRRISFTKVDLVVVLVCFVFLLANIAAIGGNGRKRAKEAVCLSNLMKWGQIFQDYTANNDGYFHARQLGTPEGYKKMWMYTYKPHYIDPVMRFCPTAMNPKRYTGPFGTWNYDFGAYFPIPDFPMPGEGEFQPFPGQPEYNTYADGYFTGSYGFNHFVENVGDSFAGDSAFWRRAGLKGASQAPILIDSQYLYFWSDASAPPPPYDGAYSNSMQFQCINRHTGFVNACFLDFSARKVGLKELWTLKYSRTFDTCGPWTTCGGVQPNDWPEWMRGFQDY